jgi:soluble lytic murein transglycosylase-like protein
MTSLSKEDLIAMAKATAVKHGLDPYLICGMVEQESDWETFAIRYEPAFYMHYVRPIAGLTATEAYARSFSWGLMQVMGECARENGFKDGLASMCDPQTGLDQGCIHFLRKMKSADEDVTKALLLWNGGGNAEYASQVLARVDKYK